MNREESIDHKVKLIRSILKKRGFDALTISSQANFSYLTGGRGFIGLASTQACGEILVTADQMFLISENIENERLYREQLGSYPLIITKSFPWDEPYQKEMIMKDLTENLKVATEQDISGELFDLRTVMTPYDIEQIQQLSLESARILEKICKNLKQGITEFELAGSISKALWEKNIEPITILIGFDERALSYRHPVMYGAILENYALVSICARRNGIIASVTRNVLINPDIEMIEKHKKCARVYATFLDSLKVGNTLSEGYKNAENIYAEVGYAREEKYHHQGGLTGFIPRELKTMSDSTHVVRENEVYAFNPTLQGAKVEETVLVTNQGITTLTHTNDYRYEEVRLNGTLYKIPTVFVINVRY